MLQHAALVGDPNAYAYRTVVLRLGLEMALFQTAILGVCGLGSGYKLLGIETSVYSRAFTTVGGFAARGVTNRNQNHICNIPQISTY